LNAARALEVDRADTGLVLIDIQQKLGTAMPEKPFNGALRNWLALIEMAARMKLPVAVSEQYPQGLGRTLPVLKEALAMVMPPARYLEKIEFSCCASPLFDQFLNTKQRTWIVAGMECHVCVYQTVRALRDRGYAVHVPLDAVLSRSKTNWRIGLDLMERSGAIITSTETVLFDLVKRATGDEFKALAKLVK
jgi:nicotinamidase-related amidase